MSSAATNPLTSPSPASRARHALVRRRSPAAATEPRQRRRLDREEEEKDDEDDHEDDDDEPHSDTAVGTAAGSSQSQSQPLPALPKDTTNDVDDGSSYAASGSSDSEDSVPAASSSRELRLRGVRDEPSEDAERVTTRSDVLTPASSSSSITTATLSVDFGGPCRGGVPRNKTGALAQRGVVA